MKELKSNYLLIAIFSLVVSLGNVFSLDIKEGEGAYILGGVDIGYGLVWENQSDLEDRDGVQFNAKGLFSYYSINSIFDFGGGWFFSQISNNDATVTTKSPFLELSYRYRFNPIYSLGPVIQGVLDNDNSFSEFSYSKKPQALGGLELGYEIQKFKVNKLRLALSVVRDFSIRERDVTISTFGIQYGFPIKDKHIIEKKVVVTKYIYKPHIVRVGTDRVRATFDANTGLYFATDSDEANYNMRVYLKRLSIFLKKYPGDYSLIIDSGHTDKRGSYEYNLDLSKRRAMTVKNILVSHGVKSSRFKVEWYSFSRPIEHGDSEIAMAKNRRVELEFTGVKRLDFFMKGLSIVSGVQKD